MAGSLHRWLVLFALLGSVSFTQPVAAQDVDRSFDQGTAALKAGKYEEALRAFEGVWKERKTHDVAANLALAEAQLGRHRDAAEHFAFALRNFPVTGSQAVRKGIADAFALSKARVATLQVTVSEEGAEVRVDGRPIGRSPMTEDVFLEPGAHTLEARLAGHATASKKLDAKEGGVDTVQLTPAPLAVPTASATVTAPPPRSMVPAFVIGGVSVASLIVGGVLVGTSAAAGADLSSTAPRQNDGSPLCRKTAEPAGSATAECDAWRTRLVEASTLGNVGVGLLVVSAVAGAAAAGYALWPSSSSRRSATTWQVAPLVGPQGGGALLHGKF